MKILAQKQCYVQSRSYYRKEMERSKLTWSAGVPDSETVRVLRGPDFRLPGRTQPVPFLWTSQTNRGLSEEVEDGKKAVLQIYQDSAVQHKRLGGREEGSQYQMLGDIF